MCLQLFGTWLTHICSNDSSNNAYKFTCLLDVSTYFPFVTWQISHIRIRPFYITTVCKLYTYVCMSRVISHKFNLHFLNCTIIVHLINIWFSKLWILSTILFCKCDNRSELQLAGRIYHVWHMV